MVGLADSHPTLKDSFFPFYKFFLSASSAFTPNEGKIP